MMKCLLVYGVLGVLLIPTKCNQISVCVEDDNDLRVDCRMAPQPNKIDSYEFSWSYGTKEFLINTNVSGSSAEGQFKGKSYVNELKPHGYRLTVINFGDKQPHNTTYMCKITGVPARINVEKDTLVRCSAVSVFLERSSFWIVCGLLFLYKTHM
ncbi:thy-1 membrane glycoprotein [Antennarius striatus]|uniref:thy-1 membrane glycoprotein n=1 Tax=Antennarius striatus TaxID=241820 RepID=UPI0035B094E1